VKYIENLKAEVISVTDGIPIEEAKIKFKRCAR